MLAVFLPSQYIKSDPLLEKKVILERSICIRNFSLAENKSKANYYGMRKKVFNCRITYKFPNIMQATSSVENIKNVKITFLLAI